MTVLCVDNELDILQAMKRLLHKKNYILLLATIVVKALELMQQNDVSTKREIADFRALKDIKKMSI